MCPTFADGLHLYEVGTCPLLVEVLWARGSDLGCFSSHTYKFVYTVPGESE